MSDLGPLCAQERTWKNKPISASAGPRRKPNRGGRTRPKPRWLWRLFCPHHHPLGTPGYGLKNASPEIMWTGQKEAWTVPSVRNAADRWKGIKPRPSFLHIAKLNSSLTRRLIALGQSVCFSNVSIFWVGEDAFERCHCAFACSLREPRMAC
jgi:hypothetical protein